MENPIAFNRKWNEDYFIVGLLVDYGNDCRNSRKYIKIFVLSQLI